MTSDSAAPAAPSATPASTPAPNDGVWTITLSHWREFYPLVTATDMLRPGLIWRGQRRDWLLKPLFERSFGPEVPPEGAGVLDREAHEADERRQWELRYAAHLARFKIATAGRRGLNPRNLDGVAKHAEDENDEWWALGQHYGLRTPFLDWSESPVAALFFAFLGDSSADIAKEEFGEHYRFVYALDRFPIELWNSDILDRKKRSLLYSPLGTPRHDPGNPDDVARAHAQREADRRERLAFDKIRIIRPTTDENLRLLSQGGVFTQVPPGRDVEGFVREAFKGTKDVPMLKIRIKDSDQRDCLVALNRMAVNHRTLFPDLTGAAEFVNMTIEDPMYQGA